MSLSRRNPKRDANEKAICEALEAVGATITRISGVGAPDALARYQGRLYAFEIKSEKGRRTVAQEVTNWPIVRSVDEAFALIGVPVGAGAR